MGASRADKEIYFEKLKELLNKYGTLLSVLFLVVYLNLDISQPLFSWSMSTTLVQIKCIKSV